MTPEEFRRSGTHYTDAIPILTKWLPAISRTRVKDSPVRLRPLPWAKQAARALIKEFRSARQTPPHDTTWKWAIGQAVSVVADKSVFSEVVKLVRDKRHGNDREMLVLAIGNMRDKRAAGVLIELLEDDQVAGHAIMALGKLKAKKAEPHIQKFISHPKAWVRKEAEKALRNIRRD